MTDIIQYEGIENLGTTADLINGKPIYDLDRIIETSGFTTAGDGGAGKWKQNGVTGQTPSQTPAQLGDALLNDANGNQWQLIRSSSEIIDKIGLSEESFIAAINAFENVDLNGNIISFTTSRVTISSVSGKIFNGTLNITLSDPSFRALFFLDGGGFEDTHINLDIPIGGQVALFRPVGDDSYVKNCNIDGGASDNGSTLNADCFLVQVDGSSDVKNFSLEKNKIKNVSFVHLKTNTTTTRQDGWKTNYNEFSNIYKEGVGLNTPNGGCDDFQVIGNSFLSHGGIKLGFYSLYIACASGENVQIKNNYFSGVVDQCVHIEEAARNFTITGNTGNVDCKGGVIAFTENNVAGSYDYPEKMIVSGNVFTKSGSEKEAGTIGLWFTDNSLSVTPTKNNLITGNHFIGFENGYSFDADDESSSLITSNYATGCINGYRAKRYITTLCNNISQDCDVALLNSSSYTCDVNSHISTRCASLVSGRFNLFNLTINYPIEVFSGSGTAYHKIIEENARTRIKCDLKTNAIRDASSNNVSGRIISASYDGLTLNTNNETTNEIGGVQTSITTNSGFISMSIFSSAAGDVISSVNISGFINIQD